MLQNIDTNRDHLTTPEAAERSGLTRVYLGVLLRKGTLEGFRRGRDWFVYADSLEAFLASPRKSGPKGPRKPPTVLQTRDVDQKSRKDGLNWRLATYQDATGSLTGPLSDVAGLIEEDAYNHYEDTLAMGWGCLYSGKLAEIAPRIERRLRKLIAITKQAPVSQQEAWQYLLCQFYQLHTVIMDFRGTDDSDKKVALSDNREAVRIATNLEDNELLTAALFKGSELHIGHGNYDLAQQAIQGALERVEHVRPSFKVNVYLVAANANAVYTAHDETLEKQIQRWLDKALTLVYKGKLEQDSNFFKPNLAAVHHEKAKTLLQFARLHPTNKKYLKDARNELNMAWKAFPPELTVWRMYFCLTEARLFVAEHDIEGGARIGIQALEAAKLMGSQTGEVQVVTLYHELMGLSETNPYVHNLGVQLGIF